MSEQEIIDATSPLLYERGKVVSHSSDSDGMPDVGLSVGLGGGRLLYVGEVPGLDGDTLVIYSQGDKTVLAEFANREVLDDLLPALAVGLSN